MRLKTCTKCKQLKREDYFHKNKTKKDGLESNCKRCRSLHYNEVRKKKKDNAVQN